MFKKLAVAALGLALSVTPAFALTQFYQQQSGHWSIEGYFGEKNFCSAKLYYTDTSYVSIFNMANSDEFSMMIYNTDWNMLGQTGVTYSGEIIFTGSAGVANFTMEFELKDNRTIVVRNLTNDFLQSWTAYRNMQLIMPSGIPNLNVPLRGTMDAVTPFAECIDQLNGH